MDVRFTATRLAGTGKVGALKPDADGYYTLPIGGLNTLNSIGHYYTAEGARKLFEASSTLMRRLKNGCLKIEVEHPAKEKSMTDDEFMERLLRIDLNNVCGHISEIWLDEDYGKNNPEFKNPDLIAIMGKVKPSGVKAAALQSALDNAKENVCFSIRSFTKNFFSRGRTIRVLDTVVTFDLVNEGGIGNASKWSSPVLENISDMLVTAGQMKRIVEKPTMVSMEDSKSVAIEVLASITSNKPSKPLYTSW